MSPQCQSLLDYLTRRGSITPNEALSELGIGRLSARVLDLKRSGFGIETEIIEVSTRHGTAKVARYSIGSSGVRVYPQGDTLREQPPLGLS
jgi:hypothetical protein